MSEEIRLLPCPRCGAEGWHRCGEQPDSLARACEERDAARRWARAWRRSAKYNHDGLRMFIEGYQFDKATVARLIAERDEWRQQSLVHFEEREAERMRVARLTAECDALNAEAVRLSGLLETYQVVSADWEATVARLIAERDHWREQAEQRDVRIRVDEDIAEKFGEQRDSARRWAKAWKRAARIWRGVARNQQRHDQTVPLKVEVARLTAERDAAVVCADDWHRRSDEIAAERDALREVAEAARAWKAAREHAAEMCARYPHHEQMTTIGPGVWESFTAEHEARQALDAALAKLQG